jgi:hypothetical protein
LADVAGTARKKLLRIENKRRARGRGGGLQSSPDYYICRSQDPSGLGSIRTAGTKVFCFFSSEKKSFLPLTLPDVA